MNQYILLALFIILGYLSGSIPFGYLVSKLKKIDIRKQGSGSTGATNVSRVVGFQYAVLVAVLDILKAVIPIYIASLYIKTDWQMALISISPVIGHVFSVWLNFKGGKGISTVFASIIMVCGWKYSLILLIIWIFALIIVKIMSLTNLGIALTIPLLFWISTYSLAYLILGFVYIVIIYWAHRENIKRLLQGTEARIIKF